MAISISIFTGRHPGETSWVFESRGRKLGVFYGSYDKKRHLAWYAPYACPPERPLCGASGILTGTHEVGGYCEECLTAYQNALIQIEQSSISSTGGNNV